MFIEIWEKMVMIVEIKVEDNFLKRKLKLVKLDLGKSDGDTIEYIEW